MKVALLHDYLDLFGGAEYVMLTLARRMNMPVYCSDLDENAVEKAGFGDLNITALGKRETRPGYKQKKAVRRFFTKRIKGYDAYLMSGTFSIYAALRSSPSIWYCHTPLRGLYDLQHLRPERGRSKRINDFKRTLDQKCAHSFDAIIANSKNTAGRIDRYYGLPCEVVYPAVERDTGDKKKVEGDYWLSVNRLFPEKRVELQVKAFAEMTGKKLKIVGGHAPETEDYAAKLKKIAPPNVEFLGVVDHDTLTDLYLGARGLVVTALDEDFGLTPVEAMSYGLPVIATDEGGFKETVKNGETGRLIEPKVDQIIDAVLQIESWGAGTADDCRRRAELFSVDRFVDGVMEIIERAVAARK